MCVSRNVSTAVRFSRRVDEISVRGGEGKSFSVCSCISRVCIGDEIEIDVGCARIRSMYHDVRSRRNVVKWDDREEGDRVDRMALRAICWSDFRTVVD